MNIFVSTYSNNKNTYKFNIDRNGIIHIIQKVKMNDYVSYMYRYHSKIAIALKKSSEENKAGIALLNKNLKCEYECKNDNSYTHIYINKKYIIAGSYHNSNILIINRKNKKSNLVKIEKSKIHNVGKLFKNLYYAVDLEKSKIYIFRINNSKYKFQKEITLNKQEKPRHLICYKKNLYILCENTSKIINFKYKDGQFIHIQEITTVNSKGKILNMPSAIRRYKRYIFVSNRGENTISIFRIDKYGILQKIGYFSTRGKTPRDFNIVNNGKILVVANQNSNEVLTFKINCKKNEVINLDRVRIEQPVCVEK